MTFSIILFFVALSLALALLARKIWLLRSGRIIADSYEEADWTELSIESVRMRLLEIFKFSVHYTVLFALKAWIILSYLVRKVDRFGRNQMTKVLHKNAHRPASKDAQPSEFLQDIQAHKSEISDKM